MHRWRRGRVRFALDPVALDVIESLLWILDSCFRVLSFLGQLVVHAAGLMFDAMLRFAAELLAGVADALRRLADFAAHGVNAGRVAELFLGSVAGVLQGM